MGLKVNISERDDKVVVISPVGEINTESAPDFEDALNKALPQEPKVMIIDFEKVAYISSMGLGALFRFKVSVKERGGGIVMANVSLQIQNVFKTVRFMPDYMLASLEGADECLDSVLDSLQKEDADPDNHEK